MQQHTVRDWSLVWVDAREAVLVTWAADGAHVRRIRSAVPPHHASTGHVRHDPTFRHGGGGPPQDAGEHDRQEHLTRFLDTVAAALPTTDLLVLGTGQVYERLARLVSSTDEAHGRMREVRHAATPRRTLAQLVSMLRELRGDAPRRRSVGAHRWTGPQPPAPKPEPI
jgi:hypothetical protein